MCFVARPFLYSYQNDFYSARMIIILLITTVLAVLIVRQYQKARKLPPGPISLPLIGNIHQLVYHVWKNKGVVEAFDYFRKTYGDVFTLWLGPIPHVSICDYETSQEVFVKNGNKYKDRLIPPIFEHVSNNLGLFSANGDVWAEMRRFTLLTFRAMGVGRDLMEEKILDELNWRCSEIDADAVNGKTIVHTAEFFDLTVGSVINSVLVGRRFEADNKDDFLKFKHALDSSLELFSVFDLTVPVWILKTFCPGRYTRLITLQEDVLNNISREAIARYEKFQAGECTVSSENPQDFVEAYLAKMEEENQNGKTSNYTMECLKHVIGDLWVAGQDTTSMTLVSAFNLLVNNQEAVKKCRDEILRITDNGSRQLKLKDRAEAHYLNATIAEIQRHASLVTVNFWRINHESTTVQGYTVDPGAMLTAQLGALHVNSDIFVEPEKFYPERFIENGKLLNQVIPFGIGKRSCVGENIARSVIFLMIGNLLLRYDIQPHGALPSTKNTLPYSAGKIPDKTVRLEFIKL